MAFVPASRAVPGGRTRRPAFSPKVRGDLDKAVEDPQALAAIAPQVPRSASWLTCPSFHRMRGLSARDVAVFEHLVTRAVAIDPRLDRLGPYSVPVREVATLLSAGGRVAAPREIAASLARLFEIDPPALRIDGTLSYTLPRWAGLVMAASEKERYGYVDLLTLGRFRKRGAAMLYRWILGRLAEAKARYEPDAAPIRASIAGYDLAAVMGMPTPHLPQLRKDYLNPARGEIAEIVTQFRIEDVEETRDGSGALKAWTFVVRPLPPSDLRAVRSRLLDNDALAMMAVEADVPQYKVSAATMIRVGSVVPSRIVKSRKSAASLPSEIRTLYVVWLAALDEAITGRRMTSGVETRHFRGAALLDAIARQGADAAFYNFVLEEVASPDLIDLLRDVASLRLDAEQSRKSRVRAYEAERRNAARREMRAARAEGTAPAPKPRRKALAAAPVELAVPEVVESVEAPEPEQAPPAADGFDIAAALQSPEAKAEANTLWREWQFAEEFPARYLQPTVQRLLRDFDTMFPTLARIDAAGGGRYRENMAILASWDSSWGSTGDETSEYVIWLARSPLPGIINSVFTEWAKRCLNDRGHFERAREKHDAERAERRARIAKGGYVRGVKPSYEAEERLRKTIAPYTVLK